MPSVQLDRIRVESQSIAALFLKPERLVRSLDLHFEKYENRAKRQSGKRRSALLLKYYEVPRPVIRELQRELLTQQQDEGAKPLPSIDALWERATREHREIAAYLLGQLPVSNFRNVRARIRTWAQDNQEDVMLDAIGLMATQQMRDLAPLELQPLSKRLLRSGELNQRAAGLRILKALIDEGSMTDLPAIMDLLVPVYRRPRKNLRPYLLEVLESLIVRSPGEALYFTQQRLSESSDKNTIWLATQGLKAFGPHESALLNESLTEIGTRTGKS
jgi:hypothetical protein